MEPKRPHKIVRLLTHNLGLKLLSLGLSVLLFSLVHSDVDAQRSLLVDVVALLPPAEAERMLVSELPAQVKVTLRGSRSRLSDLSRDDLSPLQLDLRDAATGYYYFKPTDIDIAGLQVVEIEPSSVPLTWAVTAHKALVVHPQLRGKPGDRHQLQEPVQARPARVSVRGPKHVLDDLHAVPTEPFSIDGLRTGQHVRRVALAPLPQHVVYEGDPQVELQIVVEPVVSERVFRKLEVAVVGGPGASLRPDRVAVTFRGGEDLLSELEPEHIVPYVELVPPFSSGFAPLDVRLRGVPEGIEVVRITPSSVLVRVSSSKGHP